MTDAEGPGSQDPREPSFSFEKNALVKALENQAEILEFIVQEYEIIINRLSKTGLDAHESMSSELMKEATQDFKRIDELNMIFKRRGHAFVASLGDLSKLAGKNDKTFLDNKTKAEKWAERLLTLTDSLEDLKRRTLGT